VECSRLSGYRTRSRVVEPPRFGSVEAILDGPCLAARAAVPRGDGRLWPLEFSAPWPSRPAEPICESVQEVPMLQVVRSVIDYRDLLFMITWRDIRIKYKQSVMGVLWAIFMPMLIVAAGIVVKVAFSYVSGQKLDMAEIVTISIKALPWALFVSSLRFASNSLISNQNLVTKIYFPRIILPLAAVLSQLFDFAIATAVLVILLFFSGIDASLNLLWVPVLLVILIPITTGLGILFAAANLFFRDVKYIVEVILTFAIFFTPVFYEVDMFGKWRTLLLCNPIAPVLEGLRACVVLGQQPNLLWTAYSATFALIIFPLSVSLFQRMEPLFAESV
jgi:ABC-type polysaccharide/polyol phosphate export permease